MTPLYMLTIQPFDGFFPQDMRQWPSFCDKEGPLADAVAIICNHLGMLLHELDSDDPWIHEAYDQWNEVWNECHQRIIQLLEQENCLEPGKHDLEAAGTYNQIMPFMKRNGYTKGSGWWCKA